MRVVCYRLNRTSVSEGPHLVADGLLVSKSEGTAVCGWERSFRHCKHDKQGSAAPVRASPQYRQGNRIYRIPVLLSVYQETVGGSNARQAPRKRS